MNQCRIAYLTNQYPMVSHTFIRREILALERQGFDILRISLRGWDAKLADEEDQRERMLTKYVLREGAFALLWHVLSALISSPVRFLSALVLAIQMTHDSERTFPYHLVYFAEACRILPWLQSFGATHIHAHFGTNPAEIAMLVSVLSGTPYSFTVHGQMELPFGGFSEKVRRAAFVVAISSYGRSQLYREVKLEYWPKVKVVHCGLETAFYEATPDPLPQEPRLICVARFSFSKGHILLIEAMHRLAIKGIKFNLVFAGDGEMRAEIEKLITRYNLSKQIRITGWISSNQVREEILAARGLVLPSFEEGLPVVIMEAMALHRPVLSTYVAGIPELVIPGKTGWLFPAGSIDDLTDAIEDFLTKSTEALSAMGEAAYVRVLERHSIDTESAKLAKLFRQTD